MKRYFQILLSIALTLIALQSSQAVVTLTANDGNWSRLKWTTSGAPGATGSGIDGSSRVLAWTESGIFRINDDNDLFQFAVPAGHHGLVDVTDIETNDDGFSVLDFGNGLASLGATSVGEGDDLSSTIDDPATTFGDINWGSGTITIPGSNTLATTAAFKIQRDVGSHANVGGVFVRVRTEVIPEPSSGILMLLGMVGLATRRRRA